MTTTSTFTFRKSNTVSTISERSLQQNDKTKPQKQNIQPPLLQSKNGMRNSYRFNDDKYFVQQKFTVKRPVTGQTCGTIISAHFVPLVTFTYDNTQIRNSKLTISKIKNNRGIQIMVNQPESQKQQPQPQNQHQKQKQKQKKVVEIKQQKKQSSFSIFDFCSGKQHEQDNKQITIIKKQDQISENKLRLSSRQIRFRQHNILDQIVIKRPASASKFRAEIHTYTKPAIGSKAQFIPASSKINTPNPLESTLYNTRANSGRSSSVHRISDIVRPITPHKFPLSQRLVANYNNLPGSSLIQKKININYQNSELQNTNHLKIMQTPISNIKSISTNYMSNISSGQGPIVRERLFYDSQSKINRNSITQPSQQSAYDHLNQLNRLIQMQGQQLKNMKQAVLLRASRYTQN